MDERLSPVATHALKEAVCTIFWYKADLRSFLNGCITDKSVVASVDWTNYKRQIVSDIVDILYTDQDKYFGDIRRLIHEVCKMSSFRHLEQLEDGKRKAGEARDAVQALKEIVEQHDEKVKEEEEIIKKRREAMQRIQSTQAVLQKLDSIKTTYFGLFSSSVPQKRGFELEKVLYDMFALFDLDPKASFRTVGEQIDGAFSLEGTDYLFEAKWQKSFVDTADLDSFNGKIRRKLDNTLGLFLSVNGFSEDAVRIHSTGRSTMILMDGVYLMAVLEGRIDFVSLIVRKRRHAAQTGEIYLKFVFGEC